MYRYIHVVHAVAHVVLYMQSIIHVRTCYKLHVGTVEWLPSNQSFDKQMSEGG